MLLQSISLILLCTVLIAVKEPFVDFCDPKWCPYQGTHIACNNTGIFGEECTGAYWVENLNKYKKLILRLHNRVRNKVALGKVPPFEPASRMPVLKWDKSLQSMAELNVKTCSFVYDQCRSTTEFPFVGQNINFAQTTRLDYTIEDFIKRAINMWFLEHENCNMDIINRFNATVPQSEHFTSMVVDRNERVGCAYLHSVIPRLNKKWLIKVMFTCNYPSTNFYQYPTYMPGPAGSICNKTHSVYKGLCCENDVIDPNDFHWYFE